MGHKWSEKTAEKDLKDWLHYSKKNTWTKSADTEEYYELVQEVIPRQENLPGYLSTPA